MNTFIKVHITSKDLNPLKHQNMFCDVVETSNFGNYFVECSFRVHRVNTRGILCFCNNLKKHLKLQCCEEEIWKPISRMGR